mgnify:FL=1
MFRSFYLAPSIQVVESPCDAALIPDGAALSAYQYFENVRNFLVAVQELGIPSFEASDLEQVGLVAVIMIQKTIFFIVNFGAIFIGT